MSTRRYSYPLKHVVSLVAVPLGFAITGVALLPRSSVPLRSAILALQTGQTPLVQDIFGLLAPWVFILVGVALLALYTEVVVATAGLRVRVNLLMWAFVPWQDVLGLTVTPIAGGNDPRLWQFIQVRKLTIWHRLASLCYLTGCDPVIIVNRNMRGYDELVATISEHLDRREGRAQGEEAQLPAQPEREVEQGCQGVED